MSNQQTQQSPVPVGPGVGLAQPGIGTSSPSGGALQDVLPEVQTLARKCGGLDKLAEIVDNLRTSKPV
jgi:hypothetical protein